jgi:GAF domain-containing protein
MISEKSSGEKKSSEIVDSVFIEKMVKAVLDGETDLIAGLANVSAVLNQYLENINWVGFYLLKGADLFLGPFQGLPACARIAAGKGVCGKAVAENKPLVVPNVHEFPGHIACDSASNSEIVIPLTKNNSDFGVLDIDSPLFNRFSAEEAESLIRIGTIASEFVFSI